MSDYNKYISTDNCIHSMDSIIKELYQARKFLLSEMLEFAEYDLIDALSETSNTLKCINFLENIRRL
jgi:hypothetical protein